MGQKLIEAQRTADYNTLTSDAATALMNLQERYQEDTDYRTMRERAEKDIFDLKKSMLEGVKDPVVADAFDLKFEELARYKLFQIGGYARKGLIAEGQASIVKALDQYAEALVSAGTPQEKKQYWSLIGDTIGRGVKAGYFNAVWAEEQKIKMSRQIPAMQVEHDILKFGPDMVLSSLEGKGPLTYDMDDDIRLQMIGAAQSESNRQRVNRERIQKEKEAELKPWKTDNHVWGQLYDAVRYGQLDGNPVTQEQTMQAIHDAFMMEKVSKEDRVKLENMLLKDTYQDIWFKRTEKLFNDTFGKDALYGFADPMAAGPYHTAMAELIAAVEEEGLRGRQIFDRGREIIQPHLSDFGEDLAEQSLEAEPPTWLEKGWAFFKGGVLHDPYAWPRMQERMKYFERAEEIEGEEMPPASAYKNKVLHDAKTGKYYRSDGVKWVEVEVNR